MKVKIKNSKGKKIRIKKNNKKKDILIVIGTLIFISWIVIKSSLVDEYNRIGDYESFLKGFDNVELRTIYPYTRDTKYLKYKNVSFRNFIDDDFDNKTYKTLNGDTAIQYYTDYENNSLTIGSDYTYVDMYKADHVYFDNEISSFFELSSEEKDDYLKKNNITSDTDLFYLMQNVSYDDVVSIFTPIYKIKQMGSLKLFASVSLPSIDEFIILKGKYNGYILKTKNKYTEINIEKDGKRYIIGMAGSYFQSDFIYSEILSTLVIE